MIRRSLLLVSILLLALVPLPSAAAGGGCERTGDVLADDSDADGGGAGPASETLCLRAADDASDLHLFLDLAGTGVDPAHVFEFQPMFWDLYFTARWAPTPVTYLVEVQWDGTELRAIFLDPVTFVLLPGKTAHATFEDATLHVRIPRAEILDPVEGDVADRVYAETFHCLEACSGYVLDDVVPEDRSASYTFGGATAGKGPLCPTVLHDDANGDSTDAAGLREITRFAAAEDDGNWMLCIRVEDATSLPADETHFRAAWRADYEGPGVLYEVTVTFAPDGGTSNIVLRKGVDGVAALSNLAADPFAALEKNVLRIVFPKSLVGSPEAGDVATALRAGVFDAANVLADRAPDSGGVAYAFGA